MDIRTDLDWANFLRDSLHQAHGCMETAYRITKRCQVLVGFGVPISDLIVKLTKVQRQVQPVVDRIRATS